MAAKTTHKDLEKRVKELEREVRAYKQAEMAQHDNEMTYKQLADLLPQTVFEVDKQGNITFANRHAFETFGYTQEDLKKGFSALRWFIRKDRDRVRENIRKVLSGEKLHGQPYTALRRDGSTFPAIAYASAIIVRKGKPTGLRGVLIDITKRKQAREALKTSEETLKALLNACSESAFLIDNEGSILAINETAAQRLHKNMDELLGVNVYSSLPPKAAKRRKMWTNKVIRSHKEVCFEDEVDGRVMSNSVYPVLDKRGKVIQLAVYGRDITEQKRVVAEMKEKQAALQAKRRELQEVNAALRVLLEGRDKARRELEERVLSNVKELVGPYINRLKKSGLDAKQMTYLRILESNLNDIVSPFVRQLSSKYSTLTPTEIQVAQLIREGKNTREIAELLSSSKRTIESHRQSIRTKLGVKGAKANLRSYLFSM
ncbi:MAG: PAS domain S-box protein [Desulfobacterales bacterium]|nr:MAG: PAS domain S-box protein [Desulfobacterales bacterium]